MNLELLKNYAVGFVGRPYYYSGDNPISGFDCSGLVSEILRAAGVLPWNVRLSAQPLFYRLKPLSGTPQFPALGDIAFYGASADAITHVAFCLDGYSILEAGGGDEKTINASVAASQDAFVRIRPWSYRKFPPMLLRPTYPGVI